MCESIWSIDHCSHEWVPDMVAIASSNTTSILVMPSSFIWFVKASLCTTLVLLFVLLTTHSISAPFSFHMFFFEPFSSRSLPKAQCIGSSQMSKTTSPFVLTKLYNHHICLNALLNLTTSLTASLHSNDLCDLSHLVRTNKLASHKLSNVKGNKKLRWRGDPQYEIYEIYEINEIWALWKQF